MSADGGPAFPIFPESSGGHAAAFMGMSLRDYFAAKAMLALMCTPKPAFGQISADDLSTMAYQMADAMVRSKQA